MKITLKCRCGAEFSGETEGDGYLGALKQLRDEWLGGHVACRGLPLGETSSQAGLVCLWCLEPVTAAQGYIAVKSGPVHSQCFDKYSTNEVAHRARQAAAERGPREVQKDEERCLHCLEVLADNADAVLVAATGGSVHTSCWEAYNAELGFDVDTDTGNFISDRFGSA